MAQVIKTTGFIKEIEPENGTDFSLEEMRKIVGGNIEIVSTRDGKKRIVVNEDGKMKRLPFNSLATSLYTDMRMPHDLIVGDVLVCDVNQIV